MLPPDAGSLYAIRKHDWLIFIKARNKRTCNEYYNSDNESDT